MRHVSVQIEKYIQTFSIEGFRSKIDAEIEAATRAMEYYIEEFETSDGIKIPTTIRVISSGNKINDYSTYYILINAGKHIHARYLRYHYYKESNIDLTNFDVRLNKIPPA